MKFIIFWRRKQITPQLCAAMLLAAQIANAEELTPSAFGVLTAYDIVIAGELHDNAEHHQNQADIAKAISPRAIVFEMLSPEQARGAVDAPRNDPVALEKSLKWSDGPWPDFAMYFPIFAAAPDALIYGAAMPRENVREALTAGAATVFGSQAEDYGLDAPLDVSEQETRNALQMAAHCDALPEEILPGMVEAQRLRDAHFSRVTVQAFAETGGPVLVITGNGHARTDWGMPRFLGRVASRLSLVSVGQILQPTDDAPYDRWIVSGAHSASDKDHCAAFK